MRWEKRSKRSDYLIAFLGIHAMEIVCDAYYEGFINWNTYQKVLERIKTNMNGNWMFEQKQKENTENGK